MRGLLVLVLLLVVTAADTSETCDDPSASAAASEVDSSSQSESASTAAPVMDNDCEDVNENCPAWASSGECPKNPGFMKVECAHSCNTCSNRDIKKRCKRDPGEVPSMVPLDPKLGLDAWMEHAASLTQYGPRVLSRAPWVIVFDSFLSESEVADMRAVYDVRTLERSSNVGRMNELGRYDKAIDSSRTSENAWCDGECAKIPVVWRVSQRIGNVTGCGELYSEYLQMLRYEPGQYYKTHHVSVPHRPKTHMLCIHVQIPNWAMLGISRDVPHSSKTLRGQHKYFQTKRYSE